MEVISDICLYIFEHLCVKCLQRVVLLQLVKQGEGVTLVLQVRQKNSGLYLCEAHNERGSQRSPHLALEVNSPKGNTRPALSLYDFVLVKNIV